MSKPSSLELVTCEQEKNRRFFMRLDLRNRTQACVSAAQIVVGIEELSP
ncbi:MAG: hypothetical protein WC966_02685 [Bradymonadales bacterium]